MNELVKQEKIENMIYEVRGVQVMLDSDLAKLYQCSKIKVNIIIYTKEINKETFEKYNKQYNNIKVKISNKYHDRFIILDYKSLYLVEQVLKIYEKNVLV